VPTPPPVRKVVVAVPVTPVRSRLAITGSSAAAEAALAGGLIFAGAGVLVLRRRLRCAAS
jgi:LPXTG-motif cell wall-anchored protein